LAWHLFPIGCGVATLRPTPCVNPQVNGKSMTVTWRYPATPVCTRLMAQCVSSITS